MLLPFNGVNARSVVVLDNASIHHVSGVVDNVQFAGALIYYLPPYSPDLNPIEHVFSKVKKVLKINEVNWSNLDTETALISAFKYYSRRLSELDSALWLLNTCLSLIMNVIHDKYND